LEDRQPPSESTTGVAVNMGQFLKKEKNEVGHGPGPRERRFQDVARNSRKKTKQGEFGAGKKKRKEGCQIGRSSPRTG